MSKRIRVGDKTYVVPDDATDEEITGIVDQPPAPTPVPATPPVEHPGALSTLGSDLWSMAKGIPSIVANATPVGDLYQNIAHYGEREKNLAEHATEQKQQGYSLPYRILSPGAEALGVNVRGMEESAKGGDTGGVLGHAAAVPAAMAITAGVTKGIPAIKPIAGKALSAAGDIVDPDITGLVSPRLAHLQRVAGRVGKVLDKPAAPPPIAPQLEAPPSETAQHLSNVIEQGRARAAQEPFPRQSEGLPEVEEAQPVATEHLRKAIATPHEPQPLPAIKPAKVGALLNQGLGGTELKPNVPLRQQLPNAPKPAEVPEAPPVPKESSVIKAHSYDPEAREMTVKTQNGNEYVHGDVSPEQAQAFASAESKGKAWNALRSNSTLVAKIVNGKRVAITPTAPRMATPNDLTPILQESVRQVKAKR